MVTTDPAPHVLTGGQKLKTTPRISAEISAATEIKPDGVQVGIDWLEFTMTPQKGPLDAMEWRPDTLDLPKNKLMDDTLLAVSMALGCHPSDWHLLEFGLLGWKQQFLGPGGARLLFDAPGEREDFHIVLPGKACSMISEDQMRSLMRFCLGRNGKATRIDTKIDDYSRLATPELFRQSLERGDAVTHAEKALVVHEFDVGSPVSTGDTVYLGSPRSRQKLRVYDKNLESEGDLDCIRWELEVRKEAAITMLAQLVDGDWAAVMTSRLVAFVDFRDSATAVNSSAPSRDRPRLAWFEKLVGMAVKASAYLPTLPRTVEDVAKWFSDQVGTSLAMLFRFWGGDMDPLYRIISDGERRLRPKHLAMLAAAG